MSVQYICRHCHSSIGEINEPSVDEFQLGFHFLTPAERKDVIAYSPEGDVTVKIICDYCKEALDAHPELNLVNNPLQ